MEADRRRRQLLEFFFGDYIDSASTVLEVGRGEDWLGDYLVASGFGTYRRLDVRPPADCVGEPERWRELGLTAGSIDLLIAFDPALSAAAIASLRDLVRPGGMLFLIRRVEADGRWRRFRRWLSGEPSASDTMTGLETGFRMLAERRSSGGERFLRLQRQVGSGD